MSKTIDVEAGDTWTIGGEGEPLLMQHRDMKHRQVGRTNYSVWYNNCVSWSHIPSWVAIDILSQWGYTITTPAAKDEAPAKTEPTTDVPVVDAVWVERTHAVGGKSLYVFHGQPNADVYIRQQSDGTARIVRLTPDADAIKAVVREMMENYSATDHNARATADDAKVRAADAIELANDARDRGRKANERLDALESRLAAEKPTDKDAARVVKAPKNEQLWGSSGHSWWCERDRQWIDALASQGIKVEAAE